MIGFPSFQIRSMYVVTHTHLLYIGIAYICTQVLFRRILELQDYATGDLASVHGFTINFLKDLSKVGKCFTQLHWTVHNPVTGNNKCQYKSVLHCGFCSPLMDFEGKGC